MKKISTLIIILVFTQISFALIIQTPEAPSAEAKKKKVVEKATSGLKDALKTNV